MIKYHLLLFAIIFLTNVSFSQNVESISISEPILDSTLAIYPNSSYLAPFYIKNKNYIVFQKSATDRKILKNTDIESFVFPLHNNGLFALDKNGIYYNGDFIATDTTGFRIVAQIRNTDNIANLDIVWKTKYKIFKNDIEIKENIDVESFSTVGYNSTLYFKDKNYVYYNFKRIKNADVNSLSETFNETVYDKNYVYINGEIAIHNGDTLRSINDYLIKASKEVLTLTQHTVVPYIDAKTIQPLSKHYSIDKNFTYYNGEKTAIIAKDPENIKVWDQANFSFISDGKMVYSGSNFPIIQVDAASFGLIPFSSYFFDKKGIYGYEWNEKQSKSDLVKLPFIYTQKVSLKNSFYGYYYRYIIYENQAYDIYEKKIYQNLSPDQINAAKNNQRINIPFVDKIAKKKFYENHLYETNNKIHFNGKETIADTETFERILNFYKDKNNIYSLRYQELLPVRGLDTKTVYSFFNFLADKNYIYSGTNKVIKNINVEILAIITGSRPGCGLDKTPSSDYYLLKNDEGYWLALISEKVKIKYLGNKPIESIEDIRSLYVPPPIPTSERVNDNKIYNSSEVDVKAYYDGGTAAVVNFVNINFKTPIVNGDKVKGKIYLSFVIEKDGTITDAKVLRDYGYETGKEALRVLNKMHKWIPANHKGKPVRTFESIVFNTP